MATLLALLASPARPASIEKLLMPGPVVAAHADLEDTCTSCHDRSNRERRTELCLDCHKDIAADIKSKTRYHGRMNAAASSQCHGCHTDHRGRDADIVHLSKEGFRHDLAEFKLDGAHTTLACESCHKPGKKYREAKSTCIDCHRKDDTHQGNLGTDCVSCHNTATWTATAFDHDKTRYPLTNKHREVPCASCHMGQKFKDTPKACVDCHTPDDIHRGSRGPQCADCHTTATWGTAKFDHAKEANFPLLGAHSRIACADCHRSGKLEDPLPRDCNGCHKSDDRHAGRLGETCSDCHSNDLWRVTNFDHAAKFQFALEGAHEKLECHTCHTSVVKEQKLGTDCGNCHRGDDIHGASLGVTCEQCHNTTSWKSDIRFDHDLTDFPLLGLHVAATCAQCHTSMAFKGVPNKCNDCHADDDVHNGSYGTECATCHSPNGWKLWDFDHSEKTRFPLTGAHQQLTCGDCHLRPQNEVKPQMACGSCHAGQDIHGGRFGQDCERCHSTITFKRPRVSTPR